MALQYLITNGPMQTTAALTKVTTAAVIKTMLQFKPIVPCKLIEWGTSYDGSAAATPGQVECIETDVAATVTASVTADITRWNGDAVQFGDPVSVLISVGTAATGYTATAEGSTTATRNMGAPVMLPPTGPYEKQWPLGREPYMQANKFYRIRNTFGSAINAYCYMIVEF